MSGCGNFGFPVVDTINGTVNVYYFPIAQEQNGKVVYDNYDAVLSCITQNGVSKCYHLAQQWTTTTAIVA